MATDQTQDDMEDTQTQDPTTDPVDAHAPDSGADGENDRAFTQEEVDRLVAEATEKAEKRGYNRAWKKARLREQDPKKQQPKTESTKPQDTAAPLDMDALMAKISDQVRETVRDEFATQSRSDAFTRIVGQYGLEPEQREIVEQLFDAATPDDPEAWMATTLSKLKLGKAPAKNEDDVKDTSETKARPTATGGPRKVLEFERDGFPDFSRMTKADIEAYGGMDKFVEQLQKAKDQYYRQSGMPGLPRAIRGKR